MLRMRLHFLPDMPKTQLSQGSAATHRRFEVLYGFCWKCTWLSSSERILKIR